MTLSKAELVGLLVRAGADAQNARNIDDLSPMDLAGSSPNYAALLLELQPRRVPKPKFTLMSQWTVVSGAVVVTGLLLTGLLVWHWRARANDENE